MTRGSTSICLMSKLQISGSGELLTGWEYLLPRVSRSICHLLTRHRVTVAEGLGIYLVKLS